VGSAAEPRSAAAKRQAIDVTNLVSVERARLRYAEKVVLDGVSLGIDDGDRVGVIGRNGSGKSTLLRVLAGVEAPDEGNVVHANRIVVQLVPQEPDLDLDQTALDVVLDADSEPGRIYRRLPRSPTTHALSHSWNRAACGTSSMWPAPCSIASMFLPTGRCANDREVSGCA
jgi:ATPase subunit of ABC transporter with duplicated ATPase domains